MKRKDVTKTFDDYKLKKTPLVPMVCTKKISVVLANNPCPSRLVHSSFQASI